MNMSPPWLPQWSSIAGVLISWAMSVVIETAVWFGVIKSVVGSGKFRSTLGWMAIIQVVSTPLSFGVVLILYGLQLGILPLPSYIDVLILARSMAWNPIGVFIGFLVIPVIFELALWRDSLNWTSQDANKSVMQLKANLSGKVIISGVFVANIISFLVGGLVFLDIYSVAMFSLMYWSLFLIVPLAFYCLHFVLTNFMNDFQSYGKKSQRSTQKQTKEEYSRVTSNKLLLIRSKRKVFLTLEVVAIGVFFTYLIIASPAIEGILPTYTTGPTRQQAVFDDNGRLHVIWEDITNTPNSSVRLTIKYRYYEGQTWSQEISISNPRNPSWYYIPGGTGYWTSPTTLTCSNNGSLAVGWIHMNGSSLRRYTGTAYYRIYDGIEWGDLQSLPNSSNIGVFQLQYSRDGVLFALWRDFELVDDYYYWRLYWWQVGSPSQPQTILEQNTSFHIRSPRLLAANAEHLYLLWEPVFPTNLTKHLYFSSYQNGTWSEGTLISDPAVQLGDWDAEITTNRTVHIIWAGWQNYNCIMYHRVISDSVGGLITSISDEFGGAWYTDIDTDTDGNLHVMWLGYYDQYPYIYNYYSCRRIGSTWQISKPIINIHRRDGESTNLVMSTAIRSHVIQRQTIGRSAQLVHYQINGDTAVPLTIVASSVPALISSFQLYSTTKGILLVIGVIIFLPLTIHLLRRSIHKLVK